MRQLGPLHQAFGSRIDQAQSILLRWQLRLARLSQISVDNL
jgi:hypothetical protein